MKKKVFILAAVLLVVTTTGAFSLGIGLQYNGNAGKVFTNGVALTFKVDSIPLVFATNWVFDEDNAQFGLTADYWIFNNKITNVGSASLNWFLGIGAFANFAFPDDEFVFVGGARVPVGLNMFIAKGVFEPFIQIAPSFGIRIIPKLDAEDLFFPISIGFRVWFK
jgi:hypothetical protein